LTTHIADECEGDNRYSVSASPQNGSFDPEESFDPAASFEYASYIFNVYGVKATDPADAIQKVKNALSAAVTTHPTAIRIEPSSWAFNCVYSLDFSNTGDNYNGVYPMAVAEIYGQKVCNLYVALPKSIKINK
jgi:hypothetical protein